MFCNHFQYFLGENTWVKLIYFETVLCDLCGLLYIILMMQKEDGGYQSVAEWPPDRKRLEWGNCSRAPWDAFAFSFLQSRNIYWAPTMWQAMWQAKMRTQCISQSICLLGADRMVVVVGIEKETAHDNRGCESRNTPRVPILGAGDQGKHLSEFSI